MKEKDASTQFVLYRNGEREVSSTGQHEVIAKHTHRRAACSHKFIHVSHYA